MSRHAVVTVVLLILWWIALAASLYFIFDLMQQRDDAESLVVSSQELRLWADSVQRGQLRQVWVGDSLAGWWEVPQ